MSQWSEVSIMVIPVLHITQIKCVVRLELRQLCSVGEEESEVRGQDTVLHVAQHLLVLL